MQAEMVEREGVSVFDRSSQALREASHHGPPDGSERTPAGDWRCDPSQQGPNECVCEQNNSTWKRHILSFVNFVKVSHSEIELRKIIKFESKIPLILLYWSYRFWIIWITFLNCLIILMKLIIFVLLTRYYITLNKIIKIFQTDLWTIFEKK